MAFPTYVATSTGTNSGTSYSASESWNTGSDRVWILCVATKGNSFSESSITNATMDGVSFTEAVTVTDTETDQFNARATILYMLEDDIPDPSPGTLTISTGNSQGVRWALCELSGASQSGYDAVASQGDTQAQGSFSTDISHSGNALVIDALSVDIATTTTTVGADQTERTPANGLTVNNGTLMTSSEENVTTPSTMSWTWTNNSNRQAHALIAWLAAGLNGVNAIFFGHNF
jgi:hypothetical protein